MREATDATVLGDFSGTKLDQSCVVTMFFREGNASMVSAKGPDGALHDYKVAYTSG